MAVISSLVLGFLATAGLGDSAPGKRAEPSTQPDKPGTRHGLVQGKDTKGDKTEKKRKPRFTIGKDTTYVTGPRDKDGYIDYVAALNKRLRRGVTPQNNANVLLWKAFGPHPNGAKVPAEFFQWMEVKAPPEKGEYFIDLWQYLKEHRKVELRKRTKILDDMDRCTQRPWTPKQYPEIAAWLKANEKPLAVVIEATRRSHYFSPLVPADTNKEMSGLIGALSRGIYQCRQFADVLAARAMLQVGQGRSTDAWQDLLACHRLGRLVARGGILIEALVGIAMDIVAGKADLAFLDGCKLKAKQLKDCLRDLQKLPPLPEMAGKVDLGERFMFLDIVRMVDRGGLQALELLSVGKSVKILDPEGKGVLDNIDWDRALRNANRWYDRLAAAMRVKERGAREKKFNQLKEELQTLRSKVAEAGELDKGRLAKASAEARGKFVGDVMITFMVAAVSKVQHAADRVEQEQANRQLAFALAAYQRDHGRYPKKLDALAPRYLAKIPADLFSGKAVIYRPSEKGYLLYSVGINGKDEEGRSYEDDPPGDDLSVRMPLPKLQKK
jgi:hypothetical protein